MVKYTLKKRNNKSKIKRKVKKSIKKTFKKTFKKSLKNKRKKVFRKSINKKTKNYKKKKGGFDIGLFQGQTCNEVGWYNNGFNNPFGGNYAAPFDYYSRIKSKIDASKDEKKLANVQASWSDTYKQFLIAFLSNYQNIQNKINDFEIKPGKGVPFKLRIDRTVSESGNQISNYNSIINDKKQVPSMYKPHQREGNDIETVDQRIFNLLMHEFDHFTCNIGFGATVNIDIENKEFAEHQSGKTNFNTITTIEEFLKIFPSFQSFMNRRVRIAGLGKDLRIYRFISLIRMALGKFKNQLEIV